MTANVSGMIANVKILSKVGYSKMTKIFRIGDFTIEKRINKAKEHRIYIGRTSGEGMEVDEAKFIAAIDQFYDKYF